MIIALFNFEFHVFTAIGVASLPLNNGESPDSLLGLL